MKSRIHRRFPYANGSSRNAFTLIELLVVFGVIITVGTMGLFYYRDYGRKQAVTQAAETVRTQLAQIRQKALAGQFTYPCSPLGSSLTSYQFKYYLASGQSDISQQCKLGATSTVVFVGNLPPLPPNVEFDSSSTCPSNPSVVDFYTIGQGTSLTGSCTIKLVYKNTSFSATLTLNQSGNVE